MSVLKFNIDSPKSHQVKIGKTKYDIAKPKKRIAQADCSNAKYPNLVA